MDIIKPTPSQPLRIRGLLYDLARNHRADSPHLERVIRKLAELEFNVLVINLEHRFEYPSCPGVAPPGSLTPAMARNLVEFGSDLGVEVIAQPNFIGHCEGLCATERLAHLSCDPYRQAPSGGYDQLNLEIPEARELVRAMFADVCAGFPGNHIHIGGDEIRRLEFVFPGNTEAQVSAMREYLNLLIELAREHRREVLIWGDMPLKHAAIREALPKNVTVCHWCYKPEGDHAGLQTYQAEGFRVVSCPSVRTYTAFSVELEATRQNISKMIGDAQELGLDGFLLTTWEFGQGSGFDLSWPGIDMASCLAHGLPVEDGQTFLSDYAGRRYGPEGAIFAQLHGLLDDALEGLVGHLPETLATGLVRKALYRGMISSARIARDHPVPINLRRAVWEPSPFQVWLILRPILTDGRLQALQVAAKEVGELTDVFSESIRGEDDERITLEVAARAFVILIDRLTILERAKQAYHEASIHQGLDEHRFHADLDETARLLTEIKPGLDGLKENVRRLDGCMGLDDDEIRWIKIQEQPLIDHIAALEDLKGAKRSLLEFGEFLSRPAGVTQRLTWR